MRLTSRSGIAYDEEGSGYPFIALHGYSLDRRMSMGAFEPLFSEPSWKCRRIYPDLPFMGESTDDPAGSGHDGMLAAMADFVREIAPDGPILLAGESYGGYLARGLAREFGSRVEGLFLLCPAIVARRAERDLPRPVVVREEPRWREAARSAGASGGDIALYEEHAVDKSAAAFERIRSEVIAGIRLARLPALERYLGGAEAFSFDRLGRTGTEGEPFDPSFERPACFFLGRQDSSVGWRDALRLAGRYPRASFHILDAAGHNAQIERPEAFAAAFSAWLEACAPGE
jgi:pimeloyl-ACP methyl ester carboxylesterase